jgi:hypothetical protein
MLRLKTEELLSPMPPKIKLHLAVVGGSWVNSTNNLKPGRLRTPRPGGSVPAASH